MPVPMRTTFHSKAEAKYNVTTEFPSLGLHSAAATGNVGLVEYALNNGQPINSVLDGVLPLHAACAGGNVQVVKALIDHGADVNAPRLPRKYSYDKNRDSSAPIVGTSGSTPLHFAAANGNTEVVQLLLLHGAHADRPDKHGVFPEMLAQQNGWVECAKVLRDWVANKDRDLREREAYAGRMGGSSATPTQPKCEVSSPRRLLHMKQSVDTALNKLKGTDSSVKSNNASTPPASPMKPFGEYSFYPTDSSSSNAIDLGTRRPSLPHVLQPPEETNRGRQFSTGSSTHSPRPRRPRSAGSDTERPDHPQEPTYPIYGRGGSGRKLGTKYSLLNIFKKGQDGSITHFSENVVNRDSLSGSTSALPTFTPSNQSGQTSNVELPDPPTSTSTPSIFSAVSRVANKVHRGSDASVKGRPTPLTPSSQPSGLPPLPRKPSGSLQSNLQSPSRTNIPLAVELHLALAQQQLQNRTPSNSSSKAETPGDDGDKVKPSSPLAKFNSMLNGNRNRSASSGSMPVPNLPSDDAIVYSSPSLNADIELGKPSPSPRPGILKDRNRTNSNGSPVNSRTLRFDSSSSDVYSNEPKGKDSPLVIPAPLRSYNSAGSLGKAPAQGHQENGHADGSQPLHTPPALPDVRMPQEQDEEADYGQPIDNGAFTSQSILLQRQRGLSFTSSDSSLSPILSNDPDIEPSKTVLNADFPFSINRPPSFTEEPVEANISDSEHLNVPTSSDLRGRGDSLSSTSTGESRNNTMVGSSTSGPIVTIASPRLSDDYLLSSDHLDSNRIYKENLLTDSEAPTKHPLSSPPIVITNLNVRRAHSPLDIDVSSISSHAQAEALVEKARQDVLDFTNSQEASPPNGGFGRTPLSARLAAYGESLALERKLREKEQRESELASRGADNEPLLKSNEDNTLPMYPSSSERKSRDGVERQLSLETKAGSPRGKRRHKDPRRPSTADGLSPSSKSFFPGRTASHQSSHSTSSSSQISDPVRANIIKQLSLDSNHIPTPQPIFNEISLSSQRSRVNLNAHVPPSDDTLSQINPTDAASTDTDFAPTPLDPHPPSISGARGKREQVRSSAKKLTKMGISVVDQVAASRSVPSTPPHSKRFGLKSIMQTFKNKA